MSFKVSVTVEIYAVSIISSRLHSVGWQDD
jgi:hypothetical protein